MADFKILAFQTAELKIFAHLKILAFQNPKVKILAEKGEIFQKSPKKSFSLERPNGTLADMVLSSNYYAVVVQRLEKMFAQEPAPKVLE